MSINNRYYVVEELIRNYFNRHSNADHPNDTSQPRQLKRPDGEPSPEQRASGIHVSCEPSSYGPAPPASKFESSTNTQYSAQHAKPNAVECLIEPGAPKLLVERSVECPRTAPGAAAAASESQPSADGATE
jgi:hypothetical protein